MKLFLSYGNLRFIESRKRINLEAKSLQIFDKTIVETEEIEKDEEFKKALLNPNFKQVFESKRGGGYWIWKPYIIFKHLQSLNENDILIYSDSGCTINNNQKTVNTLNSYIEFLNQSEKGIIAVHNPHAEYKWTKGDIFKHFNCHFQDLENDNDIDNIYNTNQFTANRIFIKKNAYSMKIFELWWKTAKENPNLFDDTKSATKNKGGFKENRHDQSIFSIICKTHGIESKFNFHKLPIKLTRIRK